MPKTPSRICQRLNISLPTGWEARIIYPSYLNMQDFSKR